MESGFAVPVSISEAARVVGIDPDKARYWLKLLEVETTKAGKNRCVAPEAVTLLATMNSLIVQGTSPSDAARIAKETPVELSPVIAEAPKTMEPLQEQIEEMKRAFLLLGEAFKSEVQGLKNEIRNLAEENRSLRLQMLPAPKPEKIVEPWHPQPTKDPLEGLSWMKKAYIQLVEPWRMRRYDS